MRCLIASIAGCLACTGSVNAAEIVLEAGIEDFQVEQPAPAELLRKLSPLLDATGTEELRVAPVDTYSGNEYLIDGRGRPVEALIWLDQFIAGHPVQQSYVYIRFNTRTREVTLLNANFLPDRGLNHASELTADQARAMAVPQLRKPSEPLTFTEIPARLVYAFERTGEFGGRDGYLVWMFSAQGRDPNAWYDISVSATSGKVVGVELRVSGCWLAPPRASVDPLRQVSTPLR